MRTETHILVTKTLQMGYTWLCHVEHKSKSQSIGVETLTFRYREGYWLSGQKESYADSAHG